MGLSKACGLRERAQLGGSACSLSLSLTHLWREITSGANEATKKEKSFKNQETFFQHDLPFPWTQRKWLRWKHKISTVFKSFYSAHIFLFPWTGFFDLPFCSGALESISQDSLVEFLPFINQICFNFKATCLKCGTQNNFQDV